MSARVRNNVDTVILLGAGASAADGAPVQSNLFRGFFQSRRNDDRAYNPTYEMERELATYFQLIWGINVDHDDLTSARFPTFEEALGLLELAEERGEFFRGFGGHMQVAPRGLEMRAHLVSLIAVYLEERLRTGARYHQELVERLLRLGYIQTAAFISLNYDILIDNALLVANGVSPDYGVEFSNAPGLCPAENAVPLLKLHGSLNWLYCPTCNALDYYPGEKIAAALWDRPERIVCERCDEPRVPIIIPPTFFKAMSNFYLQQTWKHAEEILRRAKKLVFCGYSFPDADIHVKYLLKRAEVNANGLPPQVFIINEHAAKDPEQRELEKDRYLRFFRGKNEVQYMGLSFEDFVADPGPVLEA